MKNRLAHLLGGALCLTMFLGAFAAEAADVTAPYYITNNFGEDSSTELLVQWHNDAAIFTQKIQITMEGDDGFSDAREMVVVAEPFSLSGEKGTFALRNIFRARVEGLQANTKYIYRVGERGAWSQIFYHETSGGGADFSFTVVGDPQSGDHVDMRHVMRAANAFDSNNKFFLMTGDIVNEISKRPNEIISYTRAANEFNVKTPVVATQGNHDTYWTTGSDVYKFGESTIFNAFVNFPDNGCESNENDSQSYYYYYNNVLFVALNTMVTDAQHAFQAQWLKGLLEQNRKNKLSQYIIVMCHIGPFGNRYFEKWKEPVVRRSYGKIFSDFDVDIVFCGHDHTYARSNPIKIGDDSAINAIDFDPTPHGTIYSIAGATGPKFYDATDERSAEYYPFRTSTKLEMEPGVFVNVKVTAEKLVVEAIRVAGTNTQGEEVPQISLDAYEVPAKSR
ncbi:MAG: metallophosphoesterase family protein [Pontiellaceae bacterium]|nr:metallophosphoesterase family protein [Pontiellaceae bacterium]